MFPWLLKKSKVVHTVTGLKLQNWTGEDYQPLTRWEFCLKRQRECLEGRESCLKGLLHLRNKSKVFFNFWQFKYRSHSITICQRDAPDRTCARDKQKQKKMSLFTLHVIANMKEKEFSFMRENCVWLKQWIKRAMTCTHCKWNVTCINGMQWIPECIHGKC